MLLHTAYNSLFFVIMKECHYFQSIHAQHEADELIVKMLMEVFATFRLFVFCKVHSGLFQFVADVLLTLLLLITCVTGESNHLSAQCALLYCIFM